MTIALVLAAGASKRLGEPKALVPVEGRPALTRLCATLRESGCQVLVILGAKNMDIAKAVPLYAKKIEHPGWENGRSSSLKAGLRTTMRDSDFLIAPVDHPAITVRTVSALLRAKGEIRVPTFEGQRGHPIFISRALRDEVMALGDDQPLHDVIHRDQHRVTEVPVDDPAILLNIDTPDDLKKLQAHLGKASNARNPA